MVKNCDLGLENAQYKTSVTVFEITYISYCSGMQFSTKDQDSDLYGASCAQIHKGAWWYKHCHKSNLNGLYFNGQHASRSNGVNWFSFRGFYYSLKRTEMKVKAKG